MLDDIDYQILARRMLDFEVKLKQLEADVNAFGRELDELALEFYKEELDDRH